MWRDESEGQSLQGKQKRNAEKKRIK